MYSAGNLTYSHAWPQEPGNLTEWVTTDQFFSSEECQRFSPRYHLTYPYASPVKPWQRVRLPCGRRDRGSSNELQRQDKQPHCNETAGENRTTIPRYIRLHCKLWKTKSSCNTSTNRTSKETIDLPLEQSLLLNIMSTKQKNFISLLWPTADISPPPPPSRHSLTWMLMSGGWSQK